MLTIEDVRSVPLFSTLAVAQLERLAETSADLHLATGEFAVHEGGERALYAVLTGKIEVVNGANGEVGRHDCGGLFVFIGADAETGWLPAAVARDGRGYVLTGDDVVKAGRWSHGRDPYLLESSAPGIFACGDVRLSPVKRVASAVGEGSMAIAFVHKFLQQDARQPQALR